MKFFHLADLHIGKKVNGFDLLEDQAHVLDQVMAHIEAEKPDGLILAGDLYDRRNPNPEAVNLFDQFLAETILAHQVPVLAIGGNHDSGDRLNFASGILAHAGLHLAGRLSLPVPRVRLQDAYGPVDVHLLPYADGAFLAPFGRCLCRDALSGGDGAIAGGLDLGPGGASGFGGPWHGHLCRRCAGGK